MSKSSKIITRNSSSNRAVKAGILLVSACTLVAAYAGKRYYTAYKDTTPPKASITSPSASTTVSGAVAVAVAATDNVGVAKVELYVNGTLSSSVTASPYAFKLDTSKLANGSATLTAIAYDKAGNKASSSPVAVTVSNTTSTTTSGGTSTTGTTGTTGTITGTTTTTSTTSTTGTSTTPTSSGTTTTGTTSTSTGTTTATTTSTVSACLPSGVGTDYQVGPGAGQLATLAQVPWDKLVAGDTVRIFYSDTPYRGKFMISGNGTAAAPIRVCGVKSATGQRPIIDGQNAVSRLGLAYGNILHETRSIIVVKQLSTAAWTAYPSYIQIDGLEIRGAVPSNTFTDSTGTVRNYTYDPYVNGVDNFGACIWLERGQNVTIADNVIHDCTNGIYSKSTNDGDFAVTKNILISGNYIYGNGVVGDEHEHNTYTESVNIVYEFNRIEPLRTGALGNAIKDRSAGTVVRYNYINGGAHSVDLVEAEDFYTIASTYASYRTSYVYGNIIVKDGSTGTFIHYGGDHAYSTPGAAWGEPILPLEPSHFFAPCPCQQQSA